MPTNRAELTTGLLPNLMFVGNGFVEGNGTGEYEHVNPATGRVQRTYRLASEEDVDGAVRASARAFSTWKDTAPGDRRRLLEAVANALRERQDEFARINALEVGAPLNFGRAIVQSAADWFDYYAGWADKIGGDTLPLSVGVPALGGAITTASGLTFVGASVDRTFRAFETATGRLLWQAPLPESGNATPMTYLGSNTGLQYVLIAAAGHKMLGTRSADAIVAFSLPSAVAERD